MCEGTIQNVATHRLPQVHRLLLQLLQHKARLAARVLHACSETHYASEGSNRGCIKTTALLQPAAKLCIQPPARRVERFSKSAAGIAVVHAPSCALITTAELKTISSQTQHLQPSSSTCLQVEQLRGVGRRHVDKLETRVQCLADALQGGRCEKMCDS